MRWLWIAALIIVVPVVVTAGRQDDRFDGQDQVPGHALATGDRLVYASNGQESPPWSIDSVAQPVMIGGRSGCAHIRLRTSPGGNPQVREWCVTDGVLVAWNAETRTFSPQRPVLPGRTLDVPASGGRVLRYETSAIERDRGDGFDVDVLPTVLLTLDSAGRPVRRLRERFSLGLATATSGAFEVPDSASPGGWRVTQEFVLIARRVPSR